MTNPVIQTDIADVLGQIDQKLDKLTEDVTDLKVGQAEIKGEIKALDIKTQSPKVCKSRYLVVTEHQNH